MTTYYSLQNTIVYGPIESKRLGRSLGINLQPTDLKVCSMNCIYCFYGKTRYEEKQHFPEKEKVISTVEKALAKKPTIDYLTFAGNGEPTIHPEFPAIVRAVVKLRDTHIPGKPIAMLSNSSGIHLPGVRDVLPLIDKPIFKLDCGSEELFGKIHHPDKGMTFSRVMENLKSLERPIIQTLFFGGPTTNSDEQALRDWTEALKTLNPREVQIYTLDFTIGKIQKIPDEELKRIAEETANQTGLDVKAYL